MAPQFAGAGSVRVGVGDAPRTALTFEALDGWASDDQAAALDALKRMCVPAALGKKRRMPWLAPLCRELPDRLTASAARDFIEAWFRPAPPVAGDADPVPAKNGFVTGYYEPQVAASRVMTDRFRVPLYRRPPELVRIDPPGSVAALPPGTGYARRDTGGTYGEFYDRRSIMDGALDGRGLELAFVESAVDAFFIHIQGSARLHFEDGSVSRIAFDGKSGHPYTPIGRIIAERAAVAPARMDMQRIRAWLAGNPRDADAVMAQNRSFIFFRETADANEAPGPTGAAGVPLTPLRSLAVDHDLIGYGTPVWIDAELPLGENGAPIRFRRLMIAQDTGSAIVGPVRGDIFVGSGDAAGERAGRVRHRATFIPLELRPEKAARLMADER